MQIRIAMLTDLPAILDLARQAPTAAEWSERQYRQAIDASEGSAQRLVLIAETQPDATPVAFLVAHQIAPEWEVENIVVASQARRAGVGKQLLNELIARANETNSESIFLEVRESNLAARTLYERTGFEQSGRRKHYYANPEEDAILYKLRPK